MGTLAATISKQITSNMYPRLLILIPNLKINPDTASKDDIVTPEYHLKNLDFRDPLTGLPLVYDIILEKTSVEFVVRDLLVTSRSFTREFITVRSINLNTIEGNDASKIGCSINFKVYGVTAQITITYWLLADVMQKFGGLWSTFGMIGALMSMGFSGYFHRADLLNYIFKFHENQDCSNYIEPKFIIKIDKEDEEKGEIEKKGVSNEVSNGVNYQNIEHQNIELHNINLANVPEDKQHDLLAKHFNKKALFQVAATQKKIKIGI